jgi:hypothetical protein
MSFRGNCTDAFEYSVPAAVAGHTAPFGAFVAIVLATRNGEEIEGGIERWPAPASTQEG